MTVETRASLMCVAYFAIATGWSVSVRVFPAPWPFWSAVTLMAVAVAGAAWIGVLVWRSRHRAPLAEKLQRTVTNLRLVVEDPKRITAAELADRLDRERGSSGRRR